MNRFLITNIVVSLVALAMINPASAFEEKISSTMGDGANDDSIIYAALRCGGLYTAVIKYTGKQLDTNEVNISEAYFEGVIKFLKVSATLTSKKRNIGLEESAETSAATLEVIAEKYYERMQNNYASTGSSISEDLLILDDLTFCQVMAEVF